MSDKEVWHYVEDFPDYVVSSEGRVLNLKYDRLVTGTITDRGYVKVILVNKRGRKQFYVHQLVACAFLGDWRPGTRVRHVNDDKTVNSVENLQVMGGESLPPINYESPRLHARRLRIIETGEVFRTAYDCARHIGGNATNIYRVLNGYRNSHRGFTFEYVDIGTEISNENSRRSN